MLRSLSKSVAVPLRNAFLNHEPVVHQQTRNTYILKRRNPPPLHKKGEPLKPLKAKHYIYDMVKNEVADKLPEMEVILTSHVTGLGNIGDKVVVKAHYAYNDLLLPGLAVYATPENEKKYEEYEKKETDVQYSSAEVPITIGCLSRAYISVVMNKENPWTIKPWHIKVSLRKCGYEVPEECITLPPKPISGPDMALQEKEFYVTVTINNTEKVNVRCRIHHWSTQVVDRIPYVENFWKRPTEPIYPEFTPVLETLPSRVKKQYMEQSQ